MPKTLGSAYNYAATLNDLGRFEEAKSLLSRTLPVARRVLGEGFDLTLRIRSIYARALYEDDGATLDDLRECPVPLTVRGTQALVSFAPLAFKLFCAARQNAVLRRSSFPSP